MADRFQYLYFSIVPATGWTAAVRGTEIDPYVLIVPDAGDVQFRLTVPGADSPQFDARQWVENVAEIHRMKRRKVFPATCGDFSGYHVQFETDNEWFSAWALHHGERYVDAAYHCPMEVRGRDNDVVREMLASLRVMPDG